MTVGSLEHVLVLSDDIDATRDFYREVVGLTVGFRPPLEFPGYWLYADGAADAGGVACLHVAERDAYLAHAAALGLPASGPSAAGSVDHIAFDADDYAAATARIEHSGVSVVANTVPGGPRQLFVEDPNGVRVEISVKTRESGERRLKDDARSCN
jgi:catechol 2,3-dioxygenase-like lactoylglutathione lyase family enzyme